MTAPTPSKLANDLVDLIAAHRKHLREWRDKGFPETETAMELREWVRLLIAPLDPTILEDPLDERSIRTVDSIIRVVVETSAEVALKYAGKPILDDWNAGWEDAAKTIANDIRALAPKEK